MYELIRHTVFDIVSKGYRLRQFNSIHCAQPTTLYRTERDRHHHCLATLPMPRWSNFESESVMYQPTRSHRHEGQAVGEEQCPVAKSRCFGENCQGLSMAKHRYLGRRSWKLEIVDWSCREGSWFHREDCRLHEMIVSLLEEMAQPEKVVWPEEIVQPGEVVQPGEMVQPREMVQPEEPEWLKEAVRSENMWKGLWDPPLARNSCV